MFHYSSEINISDFVRHPIKGAFFVDNINGNVITSSPTIKNNSFKVKLNECEKANYYTDFRFPPRDLIIYIKFFNSFYGI